MRAFPVLALALATLAGCEPRRDTVEHDLEAMTRRGKEQELALAKKSRLPEQAAAPAPELAAHVDAGTGPVETPEQRCERTRASRVADAQSTIQSFRARMKQLAPLVKWAGAHKCELRDTTGTVLVSRTKEAGGTRVAVTHGHPDELVCDTTKIPEGLTPEVMRELALYENTTEDEVMFSTYPECDAVEKPSLKFRYLDEAQQNAILKLR